MKSLVRVYIHLVFSTKHRSPDLKLQLKYSFHAYIYQVLTRLKCPVIAIGSKPDHVHILFGQNPRIPLAEVAKRVKGASSHWMNQQPHCEGVYRWQRGYGAFSIHETLLPTVKKYVLEHNQD